jgi:hypothetical protein
MTEREWLKSKDPHRMFTAFFNGGEPMRGVSERKLLLFCRACCYGADWELGRDADQCIKWRSGPASNASHWVMAWCGDQSKPTPEERANLLRDIIGNPYHAPPSLQLCGRHCRKDECQHCARMRSPLVMDLASQDPNPDTMKVLADALEDVRCDNERVLRHLRGWDRCWAGCDLHGWQIIRGGKGGQTPTPCPTCKRTGWVPFRGRHVRGCWALDTILGLD